MICYAIVGKYIPESVTKVQKDRQCMGFSIFQIKNDVTETGDLGLVAERSRTSQRLLFKPKPLTVAGMFKAFREICSMSVVNKKIDMIRSLFVACRGPEARFLIRSLNGKLRIGLAEQSVLQVSCLSYPACVILILWYPICQKSQSLGFIANMSCPR